METREFVMDINQKLIDASHGVMRNPGGFLIHLGGVYDNAEEASRKIAENYGEIPLILEEVVTAAGLHDVGRMLSSGEIGQLGHEIRSGSWIEQNGLEKGVASSQTDVYRIAQMTRTHASIYEQWLVAKEQDLPQWTELKQEFGSLNPLLLVPRTWQETIVAYADLSDKDGEKVDPILKLKEAIERYGSDSAIKDLIVVKGHKRAMERLTYLCKTIDSAMTKKLSEGEVKTRFGFL